MPGPLRRRAWLAGAGAASLLGGCAPTGLLSYRPDDPPLVTLPLALAGVRDGRLAFARLFERELLAARPGARPEDWLHGVAGRAAAGDDGLHALDARFAARRGGTSVLLVPGLFGDCVDDQSVPFGDGVPRPRDRQHAEAYGAYTDLGLHGIRMLPLPGRAATGPNGQRLAAAIHAEAARPGVARLVIVGYSKGAVDAQAALVELQSQGRLPPRLALVSVAGPVLGTPLADHFQGLYDAVSPRVDPFGCSASDGHELASITRRERLRWLHTHAPVPGPSYHSVVAWAAADETAPPLRASQAMLRRIDPRNDGQVLAADAVLPGSTLLAAARSDHWDLALPRNRHPDAWVRALTSGRDYPREVLLRAILLWVIGELP